MTHGIKYTLRLTIDTNVGPIVLDFMIGEGPSDLDGRLGMTSNIKVKGLLDIENDLKWDTSFQNLRPSGSGTFQGDWSTVMEVQGQTTVKALDIPIGRYGLMLSVIQKRSESEPDLTQAMASALPTTLTGDTANQIVQVVGALKTVHVPALTVLLGPAASGTGPLVGLSAQNGTHVQKVLDWFAKYSVELDLLTSTGRLDLSTIGTMASQDLSSFGDIRATFYSPAEVPYAMIDIPLMYYVVSSQFFLLQRSFEPLHLTMLEYANVQGTPVLGTDRTIETINYIVFSETFLKDPVVDYG
jgi:hypothetical protein